MEDNKQWMLRSLCFGGLMLLCCAVFGSLWSGLHTLGDAAGARVCRGVFWGSVFCWGANGMALVGLLTVSVIGQNQSGQALMQPIPSKKQQPIDR